MNSGLTPGGQNLSKRQTVFFTSVDPMNKEQKDPYEIDLNAPRLAWYKQKVWKKHQNTMYWVDIKLAQKKGFKFYQTRSNGIILNDNHVGCVKFWTRDRQYSFCLRIPETRVTRILMRSTWMHRAMHSTCIKHGRNIKTRCIGLTSILLWRKGWSSIRRDRTPSFFTKHSQRIVSRKLFGWKLEKSYTREYMRHLGLLQRFPWNMIRWRNWVQKLLDNQKEKLLDKQKVSNEPNQSQIQITIERWDPLFALNQSV